MFIAILLFFLQMGEVINTDENPSYGHYGMMFQGATIVEHKKLGNIQWNPARVHFVPVKFNNEKNLSLALFSQFKNYKILNANVLDFLLQNQYNFPGVIPENWKFDSGDTSRNICFCGTVYKHAGGQMSVRYMYWNPSWEYPTGEKISGSWRESVMSLSHSKDLMYVAVLQ